MRDVKVRNAKCLHCNQANFCRRHSKIRLVKRDTLKSCMWINQHIHDAYRPMDLPWHFIFQWNNETINVWSHLIGFIYIGYMQYWSAFYALPTINAYLSDYLAMGISMLCSQICMLLSTSYHIFGCQSPSRRQKWLMADQFGISTGLMGIYLSGIYTSFYHFPVSFHPSNSKAFQEIQRLYIITLTCLLIISSFIPFRIRSMTNDFNNKTPKCIKKLNKVDDTEIVENRRIGWIHLVYIGLAFIGIYPTWHWIQLHGGITNPHEWLPSLIILFMLCGMAFVFYATLVPERFCPGKFDYVGCSHQWWHLLILIAMIYWHKCGIQLLTYYHQKTDYLMGAEPDVPAINFKTAFATFKNITESFINKTNHF